MRAHQIAPKNAKSVEQPMRLVAVPITCRCIAPVAKDRYQHFHKAIAVKVNGLLIGDADVRVLSYVEGGRYANVEFTGTIPIFASAIMPAIEAAQLPQIEFVGWVEGLGCQLEVEVSDEVVMLTPHGGKIYSLVGFKR